MAFFVVFNIFCKVGMFFANCLTKLSVARKNAYEIFKMDWVR